MAGPPGDDVKAQLRQCAHDLNNVLGQVLGFGSLLVRDIGAAQAEGKVPPGLLDYAQELLAAGLRGEQIAKQLGAIIRSMTAGGSDQAQPVPAAPAAPAELRRALFAGADAAFASLTPAFIDAGWQVETQSSGADALRRLRAGPTSFEAVVAHASASEIAGTELVAAIRALSPTMTCVLLGDGPGDESAARLAGADACLGRSISGLSAVAVVEGALDRRKPKR